MHSFSIIAVLATAAVVTMAAPNATTAGGFKNYTNGNTCGNRHKKACCNGAEGVAVIGAKCSLLNSGKLFNLSHLIRLLTRYSGRCLQRWQRSVLQGG